ncbi:MAG: hypothetical protein IJD19_04435 [Ruminococcus sp.]|nr:hypothetical protein [Ruminococcus sp.]
MNTRNFKRLFYITSVIVLASVIASAVIIELTTDISPKKEGEDNHFSEASEVYILTSDGDRIVAYVRGGTRPCVETTTAVSSLPLDVQKRINAGIEYSSREELLRAIEEYCS